jgi:hypothetical protein
MTKSFLLHLISLATLCASAQEVDLSLFNNMNMRAVGPTGTSGRVTAIDALVHNPDVIYAGTASGGLWRTENAGVTWEPLFDKEDCINIGAVAVDQNNPSVIWVGTGEGNPRNSQSSGAGIYKSIDKGKTWKCMGLKDSKTIHRIIIHPNNAQIIYVAALGSAWGPNSERGVFKSVNGGESWEKMLFVNDGVGCADLVMDPENPEKLIAAMWEYGRKPYTFNSGGEGSGVFVTFDGGKTWQERSDKNGLPKEPLGRIGLAIARSNPEIIYALVESKKTGLYKSTDGGWNWQLVSTDNIGNRPFYYAEIYVDPKNPNRIYNLYSVVSLSEDGGKNFRTIVPYYGVHPDHHAMWIHPNNPEFIIEGNDGGLNISHDAGETWEFVNNLPLSQFYHIDYDLETPYNIYGGMQDNGSWKGPGYVWHEDGIRNEDWLEVLFGDGFDVVPVNKKGDFVYAMYQGGNLHEVNTQTGEQRYIRPIHPQGEKLRFNWNAAIAADPFNSDGLYYGSQYLHYSADKGKSWTILSPDLTSNDTTFQKQALSGGLTIDATAAENYTTIIAIAPSSLNKQLVWVGTDDGKLQLTRDGGKSWVELSDKLKGLPKGSWIPQIVASTYSEAEAFVVANDYRRNNWKPYVFKTKDYGQTWIRIVDENDVSWHCHTIVQDPIVPELLFLGTENGLYLSFDAAANWQKWTMDYPSVSTVDLKIHPVEHDLIIGTFGRSAYILDNIIPLREYAAKKAAFINAPLTALPNNRAYQVSYRRPNGTRFTADHHFSGENKNYGAGISYFISPELFKKKEDVKTDEKNDKTNEGSAQEKAQDGKVHFFIMNLNGDTLRNFTADPDTGYNCYFWGFERNGGPWPSRTERNKDADPPGSWAVEPGKYKVQINYLDHAAYSEIMIDADPRMQYVAPSVELLEARSRLDAARKLATDAFSQLVGARKQIELVKAAMPGLPDSLQTKINNASTPLINSLDKLEEYYFTPRGFSGYEYVTERLNDLMGDANGLLSSDKGSPGQNAINALNRLEKRLSEVVLEIDEFFMNDWKKWNEMISKMPFNLVKEYDSIRNEQ